MTRPDFIVRSHDELPSTSDEARRLAALGAPHGTVIHARRQTAGRGRQGRTWQSPPGNLYLSFLLRPGIAPARASEFAFVAAVAVADVVERLLAAGGVALKWPNDVLVRGAKLAGILTEGLPDDAVVVGIGLNVGFAPQGLPYPATCLAAEGCAIDIDAALSVLVDAMSDAVDAWQSDGFARILDAWLARGPALGAALRVHGDCEEVAGTFAGLDPDGALRLMTEQGLRRVVAGDVRLGSAAGAFGRATLRASHR